MPLFYTNSGFLKAAAEGNIAKLETFFREFGPEKYIRVKGDDGQHAIHRAAGEGHVEAVLFLLGKGAEINARDNMGRTPLYLAVEKGHAEAAAALIASGAKTEIVSRSDMTALDYACMLGNEQCIDILLAAKANPALIKAPLLAVSHGRLHALQKVLAAGADPDAHDAQSRYLLHIATLRGEIDIVRALIAAGAKLDVRDSRGSTPLHHATQTGKTALVELLLEAGARADIRNDDGNTARALAVHGKHMHLEDMLKKAERKNAAASESDWHLLDVDRIAHIGNYPAIHHRITEIFNFTAQEKMTIVENTATGAENVLPVEKFDAMAEETLKKAHDALTAAGGSAKDPRGPRRITKGNEL